MGTIRRLHEAITASGFTVPEIAERAGISRSSTYRILDGTTNPRLSDLEELFLAAGRQLTLSATPIHDLDVIEAARILLGDPPAERQSTGVSAWMTRLERRTQGDLSGIARTAGLLSAAANDPDSIGLRSNRWTVDRLVSAGVASEIPWALSGWAAIDAFGYGSTAATIFWTKDAKLTAQLLGDTMERTDSESADVIVRPATDAILRGSADIQGVRLVEPTQAIIDAFGLGGDIAVTAGGIFGGDR